MYDYLGVVTPDYSGTTLDVKPQMTSITEVATNNVVVHLGDDNSEERISLSGASPIFRVKLQWDTISESDAGTILDFYCDPDKANGTAKSFPWVHYGEISGSSHPYVVRFDSPLNRRLLFDFKDTYEVPAVQLKILGKRS